MDTEGAGGERETPARRRGQGELEAQVLSVLGEATEPVTAAWVLQRLGGGLSYSTVITILTRLHAKQAVTRTGRGRPVLWQPVANEAGLAALRMRRLLDKQSDRDAVLSSFVSVLSADDEELLRSLLAESEPGGGTESDPGSGPESDPGNGLGGPGGPGGPSNGLGGPGNGLGGPAGPGAAPTDRPEG